jgi:hypothetical protein
MGKAFADMTENQDSMAMLRKLGCILKAGRG